GPLGRFTGEATADAGRRTLLGYLQWPAERIASRLPAPLLGAVHELERCLRENVLDEVYIAGDVARDGEAMREVIHACEEFGVPFALPACPFRLARARPKHARALGDGYVHFVQRDPKPAQAALKRAMDVVFALLAPVV